MTKSRSGRVSSWADLRGVELPINGEEPAGWDRTFRDFGDQKIQVSRDFKMGRFVLH